MVGEIGGVVFAAVDAEWGYEGTRRITQGLPPLPVAQMDRGASYRLGRWALVIIDMLSGIWGIGS